MPCHIAHHLSIIVASQSMKYLASVPKLPIYFHHGVNSWDSLGWINPWTLRDSIKQHLTKLIQHASSNFWFSFSRLSFSGESRYPPQKWRKIFAFLHFESNTSQHNAHTSHVYIESCRVISLWFESNTCVITLRVESTSSQSNISSPVYTLRRVKSMSQATLSLRSTLR